MIVLCTLSCAWLSVLFHNITKHVSLTHTKQIKKETDTSLLYTELGLGTGSQSLLQYCFPNKLKEITYFGKSKHNNNKIIINVIMNDKILITMIIGEMDESILLFLR